MKKAIIILLAFGLLSACKSNENSNDDKTEQITNDKNDKIQELSGWPEVERTGFISSCVREATNGGMDRSKATTYCECMLDKMESKYPDIRDAAKLTKDDVSAIMTKDATSCLSEN